MKVLINALSVTNLSGRHVLLGHLSRLARWTDTTHEYLVLHHAANRDLVRPLGKNVEWIEAPGTTTRWAGRSAWEAVALPRLIRERGADVLFTPAGTTTPGVEQPQVSFAQNPWSLVDDVPRTFAGRLKAAVQRRAYRRAMREASTMVFNSEYMRRAYRENAEGTERRSEIIYQGIDDATFAAAAALAGAVERNEGSIVSVSVMAPHKGVETLVEALALLRRSHDSRATLSLVGSWPDAAYERAIRALVARFGLGDVVRFHGHVPDAELHRLYAGARVFALMSRCESFGIPAVEAQAFGTPVVSSNVCAIPEVCGPGGSYADPHDAAGTAEAIAALLQDDRHWEAQSRAARENAERFHWDRCSAPFLRVFGAEAAAG